MKNILLIILVSLLASCSTNRYYTVKLKNGMLVSAVDKTGRRFPHNYLVCLSQGSDPYALWEINNRGVSLDTTMCKDYPRDNGTTATICVTITTGTIVQTP